MTEEIIGPEHLSYRFSKVRSRTYADKEEECVYSEKYEIESFWSIAHGSKSMFIAIKGKMAGSITFNWSATKKQINPDGCLYIYGGIFNHKEGSTEWPGFLSIQCNKQNYCLYIEFTIDDTMYMLCN